MIDLRKRWVKLTNEQVRWLSWVIISLSVVVVLESIWLLYLKFEKSSVQVKVVEIRGNFTVPETNEEKVEIAVRHVHLVKFDYHGLVMKAATILERSSPVYIYTLSADDALKAIGSCGPDYVISDASNGVYSVTFTRECTRVSLLAQRRAYGVYFMATREIGLARSKMIDLREMTLPAFIVKYTKDGSPMYSVAVGAFPSRESAVSFMKSKDWDEINRKTRVYGREYTACVAGCE